MTVNYAQGRVLAKASELGLGGIDRLNEILENAGLGRPVRSPQAGTALAGPSDLAVLPVAGADPMAIRDAVRAHVGPGGERLTVVPDYQYSVGTPEEGGWDAEFFDAAGKKSGHGLTWLPAPDYEMPAPPTWQGPGRRPVIALLDSGVQPHDWLSEAADSPPFVVDAAQYGWSARMLHDDPAPPYGSHGGHATFIAGLIRLLAPGAQILSMKVMSTAGKVNETDVIDALTWLAHPPDAAVAVSMVLMAFGRQADPGDRDLENLRAAIQGLGRNTRIIASAGNDSSEHPVYPAAFAAEADLPVVSVGALASATERAPYSNSGPWVREWRKGKDIISIMPLRAQDIGGQRLTPRTSFGPYEVTASSDGYAWWNGTSFAAAIYAGELAQRMSAGGALPESADRP